MPLTSSVVSAQIIGPNQESPTTSGPVGRLRRLVNRVATRFEGQALKVEPRAGFQQLTRAVRDVVTGASISTTVGVPNPNLLSTLQSETVAVSGWSPHVLAEHEPAWSKYPYLYTPTTVRERPVYAQNVSIQCPDAAIIGGVICRTWVQATKIMVSFEDQDGSPIRLPFQLTAYDARSHAKVISDGTQFWVITTATTQISAYLFDTHGVQIASQAFATLANEWDSWDVTYAAGRILYVQKSASATTARVTVLTLSGSTVNHTDFEMGFCALGDVGFQWAQTDDNSHAYLLSVLHGTDGAPDVFATQIGNVTTTPSVTGYFSVTQSSGEGNIYNSDGEGGSTTQVVELSGIYRNSDKLYAQVSFFDPTDPRKTRTVFLTGTIGTTALAADTVRSVQIASRVFTIDGRDVVLCYYPSAATVIIKNRAYGGEPCFFLYDLKIGPIGSGAAGGSTYAAPQVIGRFNAGTAAMEWTRQNFPEAGQTSPAYPIGPFCFVVPSPFVDLAGVVHVPCGFEARSFNQTVQNGDVNPSFVRIVAAVGYQDLTFGGYGQPIEYGQELLMPGPVATSFDGQQFSENNLNLAPPQPSTTASSPGTGHLTANGEYTYYVVFQALSKSGDIIRSAPSIPIVRKLTTTIGLPQDTITLTGFNLHQTTRENITIAIYRNVVDGTGVPSTIHYRVDDPLSPILNDRNSWTWTFVDGTRDSDILANEQLYVDQSYLPRDPMPSFSVGCVVQDRVFCVGPDNAIWYSAEKTEGDSLWFSISQRIPAFTSEVVKNVVWLDSKLIAICEKSIWSHDVGGYPSPTGTGGNVQPFIRLPFTNGGTGFAKLTSMGVAYSSTEGGVWLISRSLENKKLSGPANDELSGNPLITGIEVDDLQRLFVGLASSGSVVLDTISEVWSPFTVPTGMDILTTINGKLAYGDQYGVMVWSPGTTVDSDGVGGYANITTLISFEPFSFAAVKGCCRVWEIQLQGQTLDSCTVQMVATYDPGIDQSPLTETWNWDITAGEVFSFSFQPCVEEVQALTLTLTETAFSGAGGTFSLEALGFEVAIDRNMIPRPLGQRIQST